MRFENKVALVTGGGSGIGAATAMRFAQEGAAVAVCDWNEESANAVAEEINGSGGKAIAIKVDVSQVAEVQAAVSRTVEELGDLHCVVNNAGITRDKSAKKLTEEAWDQVLAVNLKGTFFMCQAAMNAMIAAGHGGAITTTASVAERGNFGQANYSASKAGLVGLTRTLALECAKAGIRVNCIGPGATDTAMFKGVPDEIKAMIIKSIPMRRMAEAAEVASVHAFLCSDDASYVTGQMFFVDGGATLGV